MTDPQNPDVPTPPPSYSTAPPPASPPAYASAPPAPYGAPASPTVPGKTMGIIAFILSFFVQLVALILGIVALVQSKKAGYKNGWALAAIIISSILLVVGIIVGIVAIAVFLPLAAELARQCAELGPGIHTLDNGVTITCGNS
jgi:hypothetical protein